MSIPRDPASRRKSVDRLVGFQPGFYILLALAAQPARGKDVSWQIVADTLGDFIGGSTLYDELRRLEDAGFIKRNVREWNLTEEGRRRLVAQIQRMKRLQEVAQKRRLW